MRYSINYSHFGPFSDTLSIELYEYTGLLVGSHCLTQITPRQQGAKGKNGRCGCWPPSQGEDGGGGKPRCSELSSRLRQDFRLRFQPGSAVAAACVLCPSPKGRAVFLRCTMNQFKIDGYCRGLPRRTVNTETSKKPLSLQKNLGHDKSIQHVLVEAQTLF